VTAVLPRPSLLRAGAALLLLASPTILAFHDGGFFAESTLVAGVIAWTCVAVLALSEPLPTARATWICIGSLAALTAWTAASFAWSPLKDQALRDAERGALYLALFVGAVLVLRDRRLLRFVEPLLALGATVVACYALSTRLLPELVETAAAPSAGARLWQPLTYWNALGLLMSFGVVLAVRVAADRTWHLAVRVAASAAGPIMLLALYLTLSRGATAAIAVGAVVLLVAARRRSAIDAAVVVGVCGGALIGAASHFNAVDSLAGDADDLRRQGLVVLVLALAAAAAAGLGAAGLARLERGGETWTAWLRGRRPLAVAGVVLVLAFGALIAFIPGPGTEGESSGAANAGPSRLRTFESDRYAYWRVAVDELTEQPLRGLGSGAFAAVWRRERDRDVRAQDAHSLYLETALELGLVGLLLLLAFLVAAAVLALRHAAAYPGLAAVVATWAVHAAWDWDWQMPAVTGVFVIAVAAFAAAEEAARDS
jgi:O-antigen ligase/polysaccharide polymerase Wzy-like membrane protein